MVPLWVSLDWETRSRIDLKKQGVYLYAQDPSTEILCAAYAIDDGPVQVWHKGQPIPGDLLAAARSPGVYFRAWNANFERQVWNAKLGHVLPIPLERWVCSAALAARAGLPRALGKAAAFLKVAEQKLAGGPLLKVLSVPQKDGTFAEATPKQRAALEEYCAQDVSTERAIFHALPPSGHSLERKIWLLDQRVNDRGVEIDTQLVYALRAVASSITERLNETIRTVSGGEVPGVTALPKMKKWLAVRGVDVDEGLDKGILRDLLLQDGLLPEVRAMLEARAEGNKSSLGKLDAMLRMQNPDGYLRGLLLYYGARTGRWAGKGPQFQNLLRGVVKVTEEHLERIKAEPTQATLEEMFPGASPMSVLSAMLRGCVISGEGYEFLGGDFSQIEARVLAWFAGADGLLDAFRSGRSPYLDMCRVIFGREIDKEKDGTEYVIGKSAVLGCGFGMGDGKFRDQVQDQTGIDMGEDLASRTVKAYRGTYYQVPLLWKSLQQTALAVVRNRSTSPLYGAPENRLAMACHGHWFTIQLPSGRKLWYPQARVSQRKAPWIDRNTGQAAIVPCVTFYDSVTGGRNALYGGLITENVVQATARDILGESMLRLDAAGFPIILSVHDEAIGKVPVGSRTLDEFADLMSIAPDWAAGCPVATSKWQGTRYAKN